MLKIDIKVTPYSRPILLIWDFFGPSLVPLGFSHNFLAPLSVRNIPIGNLSKSYCAQLTGNDTNRHQMWPSKPAVSDPVRVVNIPIISMLGSPKRLVGDSTNIWSTSLAESISKFTHIRDQGVYGKVKRPVYWFSRRIFHWSRGSPRKCMGRQPWTIAISNKKVLSTLLPLDMWIREK